MARSGTTDHENHLLVLTSGVETHSPSVADTTNAIPQFSGTIFPWASHSRGPIAKHVPFNPDHDRRVVSSTDDTFQLAPTSSRQKIDNSPVFESNWQGWLNQNTPGHDLIEDPKEFARPPPVQKQLSKDSHQSHAQSRHSSSAYDLTEVAAPSIVPEEHYSGHWQREEHLEDAHEPPSTEEAVYASVDGIQNRSRFVVQLCICSYLVFFSFFGTLARIGVQWLTFYPGALVVISNLWANFGGCLIMGFLSEDQKIFHSQWENEAPRNRDTKPPEKNRPRRRQSFTPSMIASHTKLKKSIPIYIGLTTGFCGSFTSFSTFSRDMFFALANDVATPANHPADTSPISSARSRNRGYSFLALLAVIILTLTVNTAALKLGAHCAIFLDRYLPSLSARFARRFIDPSITILASIAWIGSVIACIYPPVNEQTRGQILFALPFSPVGCLLRYFLSMKLNSLVDWFPLGTLAANAFGVAILSMAYDLQHVRLLQTGLPGNGILGCQILQGIQDGFCGCLTTVSTWVLELCTLRRKSAYIYGAASVGIALAIDVVILGSVQWTLGFERPACAVVVS